MVEQTISAPEKRFGSYTNPIIQGSNPDPSIVRTEEGFFLITSSFDFFPGIPIYHSKDLIKWTLISHVLTRRSQLDIRTVEVGGGVWAPTIRYRNESKEKNALGQGGTFYVCGSSFSKYSPQTDERIWPHGWYVKCAETDIWNTGGAGWTNPVYFDMIGFDQDLFWDDNGQVYLSSTYRMHHRTAVPEGSELLKDFAIHTCTVDLKNGRCLSRPAVIRSSPSGVAEGSHIFKRKQYYYLFTAEGGTESGHSEHVMRSTHGPLGPWEPGGVVMRSGVGSDNAVQNTGHCDLVEDADENWWAVLLAVRPVKNKSGEWERSVFGRETFLVPVTWDNDWPIFNDGNQVSLSGRATTLYTARHDQSWRDDFEESMTLDLGWYRKSTPLRKDWSLSERPGFLRLWGSPHKLGTPECSTMWLRKQSSRKMQFETSLDFFPDSTAVEAGVVVWWNYTCLSSIGIRLAEDGHSRMICLHLANGNQQIRTLRSSHNTIVLTVRCGDWYRFGFRELGYQEDVEYIGSVENQTMTRDPAIGAAFTGMMIGVYAHGDMEPALVPADFAFVEFRTDEDT